MRVAHLSDIHFFQCDLNWNNIFSKDLLATLNYLINRKKYKLKFDLDKLPALLVEKGVTHVIITGDLTTTSNNKEFKLAKQFIDQLKQKGLKTYIIPGNHDHYNKKAARIKKFYQTFDSSKDLSDRSIEYGDFGEEFKYIALDTTIPTPFWSSQGLFSKKMEANLKALLDSISPSQPLIIINHFPIESRKKMAKKHQMIRYKALQALLEKYPNIKLYLCGHTHLSEIIKNHPTTLNSGSLTLTSNGSFHIMELTPASVEVETYSFKEEAWVVQEIQSVTLH